MLLLEVVVFAGDAAFFGDGNFLASRAVFRVPVAEFVRALQRHRGGDDDAPGRECLKTGVQNDLQIIAAASDENAVGSGQVCQRFGGGPGMQSVVGESHL